MGQTNLILVFLGFIIFIWFLYMAFLFANFPVFFLKYTDICVCIYSGLLFAYML